MRRVAHLSLLLAVVVSGWLVLPAAAQVSVIQTVRATLAVITKNSIGTTSTDGVRVRNTTAAAAGAQQYSPRTCWEGQGWKTDATAASQSVVFCVETQPIQGASAPTGNWVLKRSVNGGAFTAVAIIPDTVKTTLLPDSQSVANDATLNLGADAKGIYALTIDCVAGASCLGGTNRIYPCLYAFRGGAGYSQGTAEFGDAAGVCTVTKDNASTFNIYWDTNAYFLQNKSGAAATVTVGGFGK